MDQIHHDPLLNSVRNSDGLINDRHLDVTGEVKSNSREEPRESPFEIYFYHHFPFGNEVENVSLTHSILPMKSR
jgi:hypothetical protein